MTELKFGPRMVLLFALGALVIGVGAGLVVAWILWPVQVANVDLTDLRSNDQEDYILLTATAYAYDQDLVRARDRLTHLNDPNIEDRVAEFARWLGGESDPSAGPVAALAIALGSSDQEVARLVPTASPTRAPTLTRTPLPTWTRPVTQTPTGTSTAGPTSRASPSRALTRTPTRTPRPAATVTLKPPAAPAVAGPVWIPSFPGEWPGGANYKPVSVSPGQKFWHLVRAQYCDDRDERNDCPNLPGGDIGTSIYVTLLDSAGNRTSGSLIVKKEDGSLATVDDLGPEKSPSDPCNCNYAFLANQWPIQVAGAPSDTVSGLGLYSVRMRRPQAHTRYYLTFKLLTR
jgi:hypothetical protein